MLLLLLLLLKYLLLFRGLCDYYSSFLLLPIVFFIFRRLSKTVSFTEAEPPAAAMSP